MTMDAYEHVQQKLAVNRYNYNPIITKHDDLFKARPFIMRVLQNMTENFIGYRSFPGNGCPIEGHKETANRFRFDVYYNLL